MQRDGHYPAPEGWPVDVPGMELAGVVSAVGERVHEPLLGRRVCAIVGGGAQATHCLVPSEHLLFVPDHVSWDQAGGFPEAFTTAHDALVTQAHLEAGERVLISGATGGVGIAAVQIAHALGAHVIAVTRTEEHHERLRECGADETVTLENVATVDRVDVVLELVGAAHLGVAQNLLSPFARVVVIGISGGGSRVEIDLRSFMGTRSTLTGSTLRVAFAKGKGRGRRSRQSDTHTSLAHRRDLVPVAQSSPWTRSRRPTTTSPNRASSARSSCGSRSNSR